MLCTHIYIHPRSHPHEHLIHSLSIYRREKKHITLSTSCVCVCASMRSCMTRCMFYSNNVRSRWNGTDAAKLSKDEASFVYRQSSLPKTNKLCSQLVSVKTTVISLCTFDAQLALWQPLVPSRILHTDDNQFRFIVIALWQAFYLFYDFGSSNCPSW